MAFSLCDDINVIESRHVRIQRGTGVPDRGNFGTGERAKILKPTPMLKRGSNCQRKLKFTLDFQGKEGSGLSVPPSGSALVYFGRPLGLHCSQGSHRLEKFLNLEGFLEKSLKIKSALKSTGGSLNSLEKSLNSIFL